MNSKERILATLKHQDTDRTPLYCMLYQKQFVESLNAEYGTRDEFLDEFNIDLFTGFVPYPNQLGHKVDVKELASVDLGSGKDPKWISFNDWNPDFAGISVTEAVKQQGDKRAVIAHVWGIVEGTSTFLGIENCWANLSLEPELMTAWFDRYSDWLCELVEACVDAGADIITFSDDWGSNNNMLFSPRMWRRLIKPYVAKVVEHAKSSNTPVNLHSDGYILNIMDDLLEIGFSSLHPVQESAGMEPRKIKDEYGDKIVINGSLDIIEGLFSLEGDALDEYITERFKIYAPGGGFIFNTGHFVQPDISVPKLIRAYTLANKLAEQYGS